MSRAWKEPLKGRTYSNNRGHELDEETRDSKQGGEELVEEVQEKSLDMRTIMILRERFVETRHLPFASRFSTYLIGHDHDATISQT